MYFVTVDLEVVFEITIILGRPFLSIGHDLVAMENREVEVETK